MTDLIQWLNGYALLWIPVVVAAGTAALLVVRRSRVRWWGAWVVALLGTAQGAALLRSADGTVVQTVPAPDGSLFVSRESLEWTSADSIERAVRASGGRPTLVEFYTDYGLG
jgi:hypothetical protein